MLASGQYLQGYRVPQMGIMHPKWLKCVICTQNRYLKPVQCMLPKCLKWVESIQSTLNGCNAPKVPEVAFAGDNTAVSSTKRLFSFALSGYDATVIFFFFYFALALIRPGHRILGTTNERRTLSMEQFNDKKQLEMLNKSHLRVPHKMYRQTLGVDSTKMDIILISSQIQSQQEFIGIFLLE